MADSSINITAGTGTPVDTRTEGTNNNHRQVIVIGDPATNAGVAPVDATTGLAVNVTNASLTVASHAVTNAGTFAVQAAATLAAETTKVIGTINVAAAQTIATTNAGTFAVQAAATQSGTWTVQPGNTANTTAWKVDGSSVTQPVSVASIPSHAVTNAGTFAVQAAATNAGTFVVQENGAAATSLALIDDTITAQGTALGTTKTSLLGGSVTTAAPTYTTGQISPLSLDTAGALRVSGGGGGTQYTEDVAAAADPVGNMMIAVRRDTLSASDVSADGDNIAVKATSKGQLHVAAHIFDSTGTEIDWAPGYQITASTDTTRAANTTTYTIGDNVGSTPSGGYTITAAGRASGGSGIITDIYISFEEDAATPLQGEIAIFDTAFTEVADNAAFVVSDAESKTGVARIPFTLDDFGNNGTAHLQNLNIGFTCVSSANLRFAVRAMNAYVPTTNSSILTCRFKIMQTT